MARKRLKTPDDIRRFLAALINSLSDELRDKNGNIKPEIASKLGTLSNIVLKALAEQFQQTITLSLQQRIEQLEQRLGVE